MGDNPYMSPHSMDLTQSPSTIVSAERRNLGRVSNALGQSLAIARRWYPGKECSLARQDNFYSPNREQHSLGGQRH